MAINLSELKTELLTDPNAYGYAPLVAVGSCGELADMLNLVRPAITVPLAAVTPADLLEAIAVGDFIASANQTILHGSWLESLFQFPSIRVLKDNGSDSRVMNNIMAILKNGTASETRVRALASRKGSRAEQLFSVAVTPSDVAQALALP
jgi:hypothetical protein